MRQDRIPFSPFCHLRKLELEYVRYSSELLVSGGKGLKEEVSKEGSTKECLSSTSKPLEENNP